MGGPVRVLTATAAATVALALTTPAAQGAIVDEFVGFTPGGNLNGIVLGPDGNLWVAEQTRIARVSPAGVQLEPVVPPAAAGSELVSLALGPGGTVWASDANADRVLRIDGTTRAVTEHSTAAITSCGPVGLVAGPGERMFLSFPQGCGAPVLASLDANGANPSAATVGGGVFDLEVVGNKLFAPDLSANVVRRFTIGAGGALVADGTINPPPGGGPNGIAVGADGLLYVTLFNSGKVARLASNAAAGSMVESLGPDVPFGNPFGITAGPGGAVYATSLDDATLARIRPDGSVDTFTLPSAGGWQITPGPAGDDLWYTQANFHNRIGRFVNGAPRPFSGDATPAPTAATVNGTVDPRGNASGAAVEFGTSTAYGSTTPATTLPSGLGPVGVSFELAGLTPSTTYHYRVVASNVEGGQAGADRTFTTPPFPVLAARTVVKTRVSRGITRLLRLRAIELTGGETIVITCKGRGCPVRSKQRKRTISVRRPGGLSLLSRALKRARLRARAKVTVTITKPGNVGKVSVATVRRGRRKPKIARLCLAPGAQRPGACG